ncbi:hypothetical protein PLICRDRAFT_47906 [Plicaturopsis crispa FD-325 SS-3]|nr:hypothetical protein PLICRDRAFT_47906 [Plicaturopsis crispa FD-325 SS-3]
MFSLPNITGAYSVGVTTFVLPLREALTIGRATFKGSGQPALNTDTVVFTAYYPADVDAKGKKGIHWLERPINASLRGYIHFAKISKPLFALFWPLLYVLGTFLTIPAVSTAPLLDPSKAHTSADENDAKRWPLVLFSHGLGGARTSYSQICSRLAASGRVVLAFEHHDGTGPMFMNSNGETRLYLQDTDIVWGKDTSSDSDSNTLPLRTDQLTLRRHEISLAYSAFLALSKHDPKSVDGKAPSDLRTWGDAPVDWGSWGASRVQCDEDVALSGHSFGGATVLSILSNPPAHDHIHIPVTKALVLDPWLEPIASPGPSPYAASSSAGETQLQNMPRMLVINSEGFTLWKDHFERLKGVVNGWGPAARLVTVVHARHAAFSDFPLLPIPFMRKPAAYKIMDVFARLGNNFLDGRTEDAGLLDGVTVLDAMEVVAEGKEGKTYWGKKIVGDPGDVVVHHTD